MPSSAFLSDHQWSLLQPLFPTSRRGRPPLDHRLILELIFLKLTQRLPWYDLPSTSPSWQAIYARYHRWHVTGTWHSLIRLLLADLAERGGLDLPACLANHTLSVESDGTRPLAITLPPGFDGTWQASTTILLLHLLAAERQPSASHG